MKNIMNKMMISCDKATQLMERRTDSGLSFTERLKLKFHTSMCDGCTNYQKQTKLINDILRKHLDINFEARTLHYAGAADLKADILKKLEGMGS